MLVWPSDCLALLPIGLRILLRFFLFPPQCVEELLLSRQPMLIFLEEPFCGASLRSASSREWLGLVIAAFHARRVPDVMVVPVGVSYDLPPDLAHGGRGVRTSFVGTRRAQRICSSGFQANSGRLMGRAWAGSMLRLPLMLRGCRGWGENEKA